MKGASTGVDNAKMQFFVGRSRDGMCARDGKVPRSLEMGNWSRTCAPVLQ